MTIERFKKLKFNRLNILLAILTTLCIFLLYKYDEATKNVEIVKLECELLTLKSNNKVIENSVIDLTRVQKSTTD